MPAADGASCGSCAPETRRGLASCWTPMPLKRTCTRFTSGTWLSAQKKSMKPLVWPIAGAWKALVLRANTSAAAPASCTAPAGSTRAPRTDVVSRSRVSLHAARKPPSAAAAAGAVCWRRNVDTGMSPAATPSEGVSTAPKMSRWVVARVRVSSHATKQPAGSHATSGASCAPGAVLMRTGAASSSAPAGPTRRAARSLLVTGRTTLHTMTWFEPSNEAEEAPSAVAPAARSNAAPPGAPAAVTSWPRTLSFVPTVSVNVTR